MSKLCSLEIVKGSYFEYPYSGYEGMEEVDGQFVFTFVLPSHSIAHGIYHLSFDPITREIYHYCKATQTKTKARKPTSDTPVSELCWHCQVIKRWTIRHKKKLAEAVQFLMDAYGMGAEHAA